MKVKQLIELLQKEDPEKYVEIPIRGYIPGRYSEQVYKFASVMEVKEGHNYNIEGDEIQSSVIIDYLRLDCTEMSLEDLLIKQARGG
jgi:hypothetical protein